MELRNRYAVLEERGNEKSVDTIWEGFKAVFNEDACSVMGIREGHM